MSDQIEISDLHLEEKNKYSDLSRRDIRSLILHLLYILNAHDYEVSLNSVVDDIAIGFEFDIPKDSDAFIITQKIVEDKDELDRELAPYLKNWTIERLGLCTRLILRMALWELKNTDIPPIVIINEAVELTKSFSEKDAYKFVNGILDQIAKKLASEKLQS